MSNMLYAAAAHATVAKNAVAKKLSSDWNDFKNGEVSGQGLIEYVLIIAVISLVIVFAGPAVAQEIQKQFTKIKETLSTGTSTGFGAGA